jgi:hypothetical protein
MVSIVGGGSGGLFRTCTWGKVIIAGLNVRVLLEIYIQG